MKAEQIQEWLQKISTDFHEGKIPVPVAKAYIEKHPQLAENPTRLEVLNYHKMRAIVYPDYLVSPDYPLGKTAPHVPRGKDDKGSDGFHQRLKNNAAAVCDEKYARYKPASIFSDEMGARNYLRETILRGKLQCKDEHRDLYLNSKFNENGAGLALKCVMRQQIGFASPRFQTPCYAVKAVFKNKILAHDVGVHAYPVPHKQDVHAKSVKTSHTHLNKISLEYSHQQLRTDKIQSENKQETVNKQESLRRTQSSKSLFQGHAANLFTHSSEIKANSISEHRRRQSDASIFHRRQAEYRQQYRQQSFQHQHSLQHQQSFQQVHKQKEQKLQPQHFTNKTNHEHKHHPQFTHQQKHVLQQPQHVSQPRMDRSQQRQQQLQTQQRTQEQQRQQQLRQQQQQQAQQRQQQMQAQQRMQEQQRQQQLRQQQQQQAQQRQQQMQAQQRMQELQRQQQLRQQQQQQAQQRQQQLQTQQRMQEQQRQQQLRTQQQQQAQQRQQQMQTQQRMQEQQRQQQLRTQQQQQAQQRQQQMQTQQRTQEQQRQQQFRTQQTQRQQPLQPQRPVTFTSGKR